MRTTVMAVAVFSTLIATASASDQIPGGRQTKPIAIVGATIHTVSGETLENGSLLFVDGKIVSVGKSVELPADSEVIEGSGKHVYPGLMDAYSDLGLVEINSVRATIDSSEIGAFNPNVRAAAAFNPDSELIPVNRANGILLALSAPEGGLLSGRSSVMMLDGWTWEDMQLKADVGMHVRWPRNSEGVKDLAQFVEQTQRYQAARADSQLAQPRDLRLDAMLPVISGEMPLIVSAMSLQQIEAAVSFSRQYGLRLIIYGGYEANLCTELLKRENVPVIVAGTYRMPRNRHDAYDDGYTLPLQLQEAGVKYCLSAAGRFGANAIRNLPYHAASAAAFGLSEEDALRSITLTSAEILGVADRVGSLQVGKDATLFISDSNILETEAHVETAFVQGRSVDLSSKHTQLYEKYSIKYERQRNEIGEASAQP